MREEQRFAAALEGLTALAKEQGNVLSEDQIRETFEKTGLILKKNSWRSCMNILNRKKSESGSLPIPSIT